MTVPFGSTIQDSPSTVVFGDTPDANPISKYRFVYHFLPHPQYKRRATLLSHSAFLIYCGLIVACLGIFRLLPTVAPGVLGYSSDVKVSDLFKLTNERRKDAGLPKLRLNSELSKAAEKKAIHMFDKDYWAHVAPDGTEPWDFILSEHYDYLYAGENLAKNFATSQEVVVAWMNSPSHKENLLSPNYDEIGFAVVDGILDGYETTLVVQMFGRPRSAAQLASAEEEEQLLESYSVSSPEAVAVTPQESVAAVVPTVEVEENVLPFVDVATAAKGISVSFATFISILLILDIWYSSKKGILKLTGHTFTHLVLLLVVILGVWFVLRPGAIL